MPTVAGAAGAAVASASLDVGALAVAGHDHRGPAFSQPMALHSIPSLGHHERCSPTRADHVGACEMRPPLPVPPLLRLLRDRRLERAVSTLFSAL
jgi:hypothetical protein